MDNILLTALTSDWTVIMLMVRLLVVVFMALCAYECWRTTKLIANYRLKKIVKKIALCIVAFSVGRLAASFFDSQLHDGIGIFSNLVNYAFWIWILYYLKKNRKRIESEDVGSGGRQRLSEAIDEIIIEIKLERQRLISK